MKKVLFLFAASLLILVSCESNKEISDSDIVFKTGTGLNYSYGDLELYDSSAHILYFKDVHPEFDNIGKTPFTLMAYGREIYSGSFWPGYLNLGPSGPFIYTSPSLLQNYTLEIRYWDNNKPDPRNNPVLMDALKACGLLHSGLALTFSPAKVNATQLSFGFTVTNHDITDLLIIDPDKTGSGLFHYFTNGLTLRTLNNDISFTSEVVAATPTPWNSWKSEWLSLLKSGESKTYNLTYSLNNPLTPGEYIASFTFPGLSVQILKDDLFQSNGRIWMGDLPVTGKITVQ
jgi:hypothetical protein